MVTITNATLSITKAEGKNYKVTVECDVNFSEVELCQMQGCERISMFKMRCWLWGADSGLFGGDDNLGTLQEIKYFPQAGPVPVEHAIFEETVTSGRLDEDIGGDEIYAKLVLHNLSTLGFVTKKTNEVHLHA